MTLKPQASITASLASAVSSPPEISAPAAYAPASKRARTPAMKPTTGFFEVVLDQRARPGFNGAADLTDHHDDGVGKPVVVEHLHHVDVLEAVDRVTADAHRAGLAQTDLGELGATAS